LYIVVGGNLITSLRARFDHAVYGVLACFGENPRSLHVLDEFTCWAVGRFLADTLSSSEALARENFFHGARRFRHNRANGLSLGNPLGRSRATARVDRVSREVFLFVNKQKSQSRN
jgi:hypothetical protein